MIVFDSGDPGGDAVIERVYNSCTNLHECSYVGVNEDKYTEARIFESFSEEDFMRIKCYVFSSSVKNKNYLNRLKILKSYGVYTIHILDSWSNYMQRFVQDGKICMLPDAYLVPDKFAYDEAILDGVPKEILKITGNPLFSKIKPLSLRNQVNYKILFISEPAAGDRSDVQSEKYYSQFDVFKSLVREMQLASVFDGKMPKIYVKPHPRENMSDWLSFKNKFSSEIVIIDQSEFTVSDYSIVCGVNSILLYEAWLKNLQVFVPKDYLELSHMRNRPGVQYSMEYYNQELNVSTRRAPMSVIKNAINAHSSALSNILNVIETQAVHFGDE